VTPPFEHPRRPTQAWERRADGERGLLLGRLALRARVVPGRSVGEALALQDRLRAIGGSAPPLGQVLQDLGLITADQIAAQLHAWRKTKAAATVNKRRTALMHLYTVLDGKALPNPVKDAPKFPEPAPAPRALPYAVIRQIFKVMPESRSKARLRVLAYTGIPPGQIATIHPTDVDWRARTVAVAGRQKGKGTRARVVPLTAHAVAAFRAMQRTNAWGPCSRTVLRRVFLRAVHRVLGPDVTLAPYVLRHSFGTEVYRRSGDIRATQILLDHSTPQLTHRYTGAAVDPRVQAAIRSWR